MKKFYTTMSPDQATHILLDTETQALTEAKHRVKDDGRTRYVCRILYKVEVEEPVPPIKVTKVE